MSDDDVKVEEEVLQVLKPLKTVTTLLSTENAPSVSMILPLKTRILQSMAANEEDSTITRDVKAAIREDLNSRYTNPPDIQDYLHRSTALDPRFKSLTYLEPALRERTYSDLTIEIVAAEEVIIIIIKIKSALLIRINTAVYAIVMRIIHFNIFNNIGKC